MDKVKYITLIQISVPMVVEFEDTGSEEQNDILACQLFDDISTDQVLERIEQKEISPYYEPTEVYPVDSEEAIYMLDAEVCEAYGIEWDELDQDEEEDLYEN